MSICLKLAIILVALNSLASTGVILFFYFFKLGELERYLEGVHSVDWNKKICGNGLLGRQLRFSNIIMIVLMPNFHIKRGEIPAGADKRIPVKLRRQMKAAALYVALTGLAVAIVSFVLPEKAGI